MPSPTNVIKLLHNINMTSDYKDTRHFATRAEQLSYFNSKVKHTFTNVTYQRKERTLRVNKNIETLFDVSYVMFQNLEFSSRWFFAFIKDMRYLNPETTEIEIEVDVWQTWGVGLSNGDITFGDCYIEREHVANDTIGLNTVEEGLNIDDTVTQSYTKATSIESLTYIIASTIDKDGVQTDGDIYTNIYSGARYYASNDYTFLNSIVKKADSLGKADAIVSIVAFPSALVDVVGGGDRSVIAQGALFVEDGVNKPYSNINGYTPKNNKLFVYPYNYLEVIDHKGGSQIYRYELFGTPNSAEFIITANVSPSPSVMMSPKQYKGITFNHEEGMTIADYPQCAWNSSVYANWLAQNQMANFTRIAGSGVALAGGVATMNPLAIAGGAVGMASTIGTFMDKSVIPPRLKGDPNGSGNVARGTQTFGFLQKTIRAEFARIIDDYFTRFGYKVNRLKVPQFKTRQSFNYIKCGEVAIRGNVPNSDKEKIISILQTGITLWHVDNIGSYTLSNPIIGGGAPPDPDPVPDPDPSYPVNSLGFAFPIAEGYSWTLTSPYGTRTHPITGEPDFHYGVDLASAEGTPVVSVLNNGTVVAKGFNSSKGYFVDVEYSHNGKTYKTENYHLVASSPLNVNDTVSIGQTIGGVGTTGSSTGNHLHFGLKQNGSYVDPWLFINKTI